MHSGRHAQLFHAWAKSPSVGAHTHGGGLPAVGPPRDRRHHGTVPHGLLCASPRGAVKQSPHPPPPPGPPVTESQRSATSPTLATPQTYHCRRIACSVKSSS